MGRQRYPELPPEPPWDEDCYDTFDALADLVNEEGCPLRLAVRCYLRSLGIWDQSFITVLLETLPEDGHAG